MMRRSSPTPSGRVAAAVLLLLLVACSASAQQLERNASASAPPSPAASPAAPASPSPSSTAPAPRSDATTTAAVAPSPSPSPAATAAAPLPTTTNASLGVNRTAPDNADAPSAPVIPVESSPGWRLGRATYYGATREVAQAFDPTRGEGSFGVLAQGSCGYTNSDLSIPFAQDAVAAASDANPDYPGSCGRCYAVRCMTGVVLDNDRKPLDIRAPYNTYLADINSEVKDTRGRSWPGNALESKGQQLTQCWNTTGGTNGTSGTLIVRIIDSCPCKQVLPDGAPGVVAGGETRRQHWCCGGVQHFDLSYWAFEQLASPVYGLMNIEFKPVECDADPTQGGFVDPTTLKPLNFSPGYVERTTIYGPDGTGAGWGWMPYFAESAFWRVPGAGVGPGDGATCVRLSPGGGLSLRCRLCQTPGYSPLKGGTALEITLRPNSNSTDPFFSSTPQDQVPPLKVYLQNEEAQKFCNAEVFLNATRPTSEGKKAGSSLYTFRLPLASFKCDYEGAMLADVTSISLENANARRAFVCIARVAILRDDQADSGSASNSNNTGKAEAGSNNNNNNNTTSGSGGGSAERR